MGRGDLGCGGLPINGKRVDFVPPSPGRVGRDWGRGGLGLTGQVQRRRRTPGGIGLYDAHRSRQRGGQEVGGRHCGTPVPANVGGANPVAGGWRLPPRLQAAAGKVEGRVKIGAGVPGQGGGKGEIAARAPACGRAFGIQAHLRKRTVAGTERVGAGRAQLKFSDLAPRRARFPRREGQVRPQTVHVPAVGADGQFEVGRALELDLADDFRCAAQARLVIPAARLAQAEGKPPVAQGSEIGDFAPDANLNAAEGGAPGLQLGHVVRAQGHFQADVVKRKGVAVGRR